MKKYILKGFLAFGLLGVITSCEKKEDRIFEDTVAERISEQEKILQDLLLSSEYGWKVVYHTAPKEMGGFTYLMRFIDTRNVEMVSDFSASGSTSEVTEYAIQQRGTTSLVFTTRAKIHELSDPINSPISSGDGFKGEYQFGYYGNSDTTISFKSAKQAQDVTFVKATKEDWDTFSKRYEMVENMNSMYKPYFRTLEVSDGGASKKYDLTYGGPTRMMNIVNGSDLNERSAFNLSFIPEGVIISPGINVGGEVVTEFKYNAVNSSFDYSGNGHSASIQYSTAPVKFATDYKKLLVTPDLLQDRAFQFASDEETIYSRSNSPLFLKSLEDLGKTASGKYNLSLIQLVFNSSELGGYNYILYKYKGTSYLYAFLTVDGEDALKIVGITWLGNGVPSELVALNKKLMQDKVYVKVENFRIKYTNPVVTFIGNQESVAFSTWDVGKPLTF